MVHGFSNNSLVMLMQAAVIIFSRSKKKKNKVGERLMGKRSFSEGIKKIRDSNEGKNDQNSICNIQNSKKKKKNHTVFFLKGKK